MNKSHQHSGEKMSRSRFLTVVLLTWLTALAFLTAGTGRASDSPAAQNAQGDQLLGDELIIEGDGFAGGTAENVIVSGDGLSLEPGAASGTYTSPVWEAPLPFNALVPEWTADTPEGSAVIVEVRTGADGAWEAWITLQENHDLMEMEPGAEAGAGALTGDMIVTPGADVTHDQVQVRVRLSRVQGGSQPVLQSVRLYFMDTTDGPTAEELVAQQQMLGQPETPEDGYSKPPVISREVWCDPYHEDCIYSDGLSYHPVSHLIVHHTVTSSSGDSAETVRAIWRFHTFTRDWGDIGYNYLVDVNGVIYEGHLGGDDVVGTHAAGANKGSMAVALIGNFEESNPPAAMIEAVADLLAWKADQKDIDVYDSSYLPDVSWGLPHLMGHRDVYGTTACPGVHAHGLLPLLRDEVAERIGFESPYIYYDELKPETNFSRSSENWWDGPYNCGIDGHAYYTWSVTDTADSTNWGEWRPEITLPGLYELYVYAPYCLTGERDTNGAVYEVTHAGGTDTVVVNQEDNLGIWVSLGEYEFEAGAGARLRLTDLTSTDEDWGVWFDAIRLYYEDPSAVDREPADGAWFSEQQVTFRWEIQNEPLLTSQTLQAARDEGFNDLVLSTTLPLTAREATHTFADVNVPLYWRLRLHNTRGAAVDGPPMTFGVDTEAPTSRVRYMFLMKDGHYKVAWDGEDAGSGIVGYNIEYRAEGSSAWISWLNGTTATSATFVPPVQGQTYWFRSQAIDGAGRVESVQDNNGDLSTDQAIFLSESTLLPLVEKE